MKQQVLFMIVVVCTWCSAYPQSILNDSIKEVIVVGSGGSEMRSSAPRYVLRSDDMLQQGVANIADALHRLPGITLKDYGGAGGMKTVSVRGFGSQHTGVSYDGMMLSDCQTGQIDLQRYALDQLESISLSIGDADEIFVPARNVSTPATLALTTRNSKTWRFPIKGSDPMIDKNVEILSRSSRVKVETGSWGLVKPSAMFCVSGSRFQVACNADYLHADNNYPFTLVNYKTVTTEKRRNSKMDQGHGEIDGQWRIDSNQTLWAKVYYYDNGRELPGVVHYYTDDNDEHLRERNAFAQMQYKNQLSEEWSMMINGKWNWAESDYHNGKPSGGITSADYFQREYYGSCAVMFAPSEDWAFDYSVDYWSAGMNGLASGTEPVRKSLLQSLAAKYLSHDWTILARLLKSDYMGEAHRLSPSLSVSYRLVNLPSHWTLRASYKDIFRMPSFNELYFFHLGSQDLLPEKTQQFNIGTTFQTAIFGGDLDIAASLDIYYNKIKEKIVSIPVNMFVWRNINMARVDAYGMDATLSADYHLNKYHTIGLAGNYSLQKIQNTTNGESRYYKNQIAYTPVHSGSLTLSWQNPWVNLSVTGDGMSQRWTTNEHTDGTCLPGFVEFGVSAYKEFKSSRSSKVQGGKDSRFRVRGAILNIFNKQYEIVAHYPMPGRSFRLSLEMEI